MSDEASRLLMLTDDQIDYSEVSVDVLAELSVSGDPYIAGSSLLELRRRDPDRCMTVAKNLVESVDEDDYIRALAFSLLDQAVIDRLELRVLLKRSGPELEARLRAELDDDPSK